MLTGAEVPTVRSCAAAVLVLVALALGREPLTFRLLAVAAGFVLLLWPESVAGPSFQMSFAAVSVQPFLWPVSVESASSSCERTRVARLESRQIGP